MTKINMLNKTYRYLDDKNIETCEYEDFIIFYKDYKLRILIVNLLNN